MPMYLFECAGSASTPGCGEQSADYANVTVVANIPAARFVIDASCGDCSRITTSETNPSIAAMLINLGVGRVDIGTPPDESTHPRKVPGLQQCEPAGIEMLVFQLRDVRDIGRLERGFPI